MTKIRSVTAEFLRAGPRHNQLLSPLTQYLGVCGDREAGVVTLPYEHADFEHHLEDLRYRVDSDHTSARRAWVLDEIGRNMALILGSVPGLSGALASEGEECVLVNLRIVISASELALLPFELSKMPTSAKGTPSGWLSLQSRNPVCITRHIRSISSEGTGWPKQPRILFAAGPDVPFEEHRDALFDVLLPWSSPGDCLEDREKKLVILENATLRDIRDRCSQEAEKGESFSHVHILAHGAPIDEGDPNTPIGVALADEVVPGGRLATSLTPFTRRGVQRPAVVTLATCDSGAEANVKSPDSSLAHELHESGIPLVVASQFPLGVQGSCVFVRHFYEGQLWARHPLESLYDVRRRLHSQFGSDFHDWASLVAYEALPSDFASQLEELRYWQTRRAQAKALERLESADKRVLDVNEFFDLASDVDAVTARFPDTGPYVPECAGLKAAASKRIAEAGVDLAVKLKEKKDSERPDSEKADSEKENEHVLAACRARLADALLEYRNAADLLLSPTSETVYRQVQLHWLLGQVLALETFLGRPLSEDLWSAAKLAAEVDTEHSSRVERCWAHASLAELHLLRLADRNLSEDDSKRFAEGAMEHTRRIVKLQGRGSEQAESTARQFRRYFEIWGNRDLEWVLGELGVPGKQPRDHWHEKEHGLVPVARELAALLD